jgi:hypothetical protein
LPEQDISFHVMKQKVEIKFEVEETIVLRQGEQLGSEFCPQCHIVSAMIAPRAIAILSGAKEREIFRLIEAGEIYFVEEDSVRVCLSCLNRYGSESRVTTRACESQRPQPQGLDRYGSESMIVSASSGDE